MKSKKFEVLQEWDDNYNKEGYISNFEQLMEAVLADENFSSLEEIIFGHWCQPYDTSCQPIIDSLVENKDKYQHIKSLFFGDMGYEECEISWITQGDYTKLWGALPNLEKITIKGGKHLNLGEIKHEKLKELEIISGGTPSCVFEQIGNASLPSLEKLVLYIGVLEYGFDGSLDTISKLVEQLNSFNSLIYLGLVNSNLQNHIVKVVLDSEVVKKLEVVDLSNGILHDIGAQYILDNADKLEHLDIYLDRSYFTKDMQDKLKSSKLNIALDGVITMKTDEQTIDEYYLNSKVSYHIRNYQRILETYKIEKFDFENATLDTINPNLLACILGDMLQIHPLYTE